MSDPVSAAVIASVVSQLMGECRFCHCAGGKCATNDPGERCELIGGLRCNGTACLWAFHHERTAEKQRAKRQRRARRWA